MLLKLLIEFVKRFAGGVFFTGEVISPSFLLKRFCVELVFLKCETQSAGGRFVNA